MPYQPHTPLPWRVRKAGPNETPYTFKILGPKTCVIREVLKESNADFIVKACNNHENIVAAIDRAIKQIPGIPGHGQYYMDAIIADLKNAMPQVEGIV